MLLINVRNYCNVDIPVIMYKHGDWFKSSKVLSLIFLVIMKFFATTRIFDLIVSLTEIISKIDSIYKVLFFDVY